MEIRFRNDSIEIEGYVNAVERNSKPLYSRIGRFIERICKGAFQRAIEKNNDIKLKLNHERVIGGTADGTLELVEDSIGLRARAVVTDEEVVEDARNGNLRGWSFGFFDTPDGVETRSEDGLPLRVVKDMDLREVSIINNKKSPAYEGTLIVARSDDDVEFYGEINTDEITVREDTTEAVSVNGTTLVNTLNVNPEAVKAVGTILCPFSAESRSQQETEPPDDNKVIDYSKYEEMISEMKGEEIK